jgi:hypothetical protein
VRIAIVVPTHYIPARSSLDLDLLVDGFASLGHEARFFGVATKGAEYSRPTELVDDPTLFADPGYWVAHRADLAVVVTWMGRHEILRAVRAAGAFAISKTDTDGLLGVRLNPWANFIRMVGSQVGVRQTIGTVWFWAKKYGWMHKEEDRGYVASASAADLIWAESPKAGRELRRFLAHSESVLPANKLFDAPNPVGAEFLTGPIRTDRDIDVIAVGRWDSFQKNAGLLHAGLLELVRQRPGVRVAIFGSGAEKAFGTIAAKGENVKVAGAVPRAKIAAALLRSRAILFGSRWEGGRPNAANEALACGCSVVGPQIPGFIDLYENGYGRAFVRRNGTAVAEAVKEELAAWENGSRDHHKIAAVWRHNLAPSEVCRSLLERISMIRGEKNLEPPPRREPCYPV